MKWKNLENKYSSQLDKLKAKAPHALLEVPLDANMQEITKAYKKLVKLYHPDGTDTFMADYSQEVLKLLNVAMAKIKETKQK